MVDFIIWLPGGANSEISKIGSDEPEITASQYAANNAPDAYLIPETSCTYAGLFIRQYNNSVIPECEVDSEEAETEGIFAGQFPQKPKP